MRQIFTSYLDTVRRVAPQNGGRIATTNMWRHFILFTNNSNNPFNDPSSGWASTRNKHSLTPCLCGYRATHL